MRPARPRVRLRRQAQRFRRPAMVLGALGLVLLTIPSSIGADANTSAAFRPGHLHSAATPLAAVRPDAVTKSKSIQRAYLDADGKSTVVDKRKVTLRVDTTTNLRSLQLIHVSWTGAHPTGGLVPDQNSDLAQNEEYSFALFECRGTDSPAHPISPDSCWTQFADERFSYGYDDYPAWRSDANATRAQRAAFVGAPADQPSSCAGILAGTSNQRWVQYRGADGHTYPGGPFGCAGLAPEASPANSSSLSLPSNETFGVTDSHGAGQADFDIFTGEDHSSLGCSATVVCSLVAVPIEGISCDPTGSALPAADRPTPDEVDAATSNCETTGNFVPGQTIPAGGHGAPAVDGTLWWSASNWDNRIAVPLTFAPADNVCSLNSSAAPVDIYGSELMIQTTTQWAPAFCLNPKLFNLNHVQTPEPQARSLLATNNIEAAYTSEPPDSPYPSPTVNAPVALTGFGIAFSVDDKNQRKLFHLNLDARLLAKLLTESYPSQPFVRNSYEALANNPLNITQDPEFQALNPDVPATITDAAATLLTVNTDSDVMYALTSYINADPDARAWLDGHPDPWGMVVNANYRDIALPVTNWPLLDSFEPLDEYQPGKIDCLYADPVPYLPLVAAPTARLFSIGQDMEFALSQSQTTCVLPSPDPGSLAGAKMVANGRQAIGHRIMLGVVSLGDAAREGLTLASLETRAEPDAPVQFTDTTGRTFVAPTQNSLRAAAKILTPDTKTGTWSVPYDAMRANKADAAAYPGTMLVYAAIPTLGLKKGEAHDYGEFLTFAADRGQQPGTGQGDLAAGFLPMTAANGLGDEVTYTQRAAADVANQSGAVPPLTGDEPGGGSPTPTPTPTPTRGGHHPSSHHGGPTGGNPPPAGGGGGPNPPGPSATPSTSTPSGSGSPTPTTSETLPPLASASPVAATTPEFGSRVSGLALPILLGLALLSGFAAAAIRLRTRGART